MELLCICGLSEFTTDGWPNVLKCRPIVPNAFTIVGRIILQNEE